MASKISHPLILPLLLFILPLSAPWTAADDDGAVARSAFPMDGDVAWVVQVSDLHISAYHPDRAADLVSLLGSALRTIRPHLLLVSGDITGAPSPPISMNLESAVHIVIAFAIGPPVVRLMHYFLISHEFPTVMQ
uniref:Calcineurin-like phosphoesterase domain-containing protein n=1 Tax=Aegilops tauschii subsp. strangulata TaxID=200361 RepID=A0A453IGE7_AEGTS